MKTYQVFLGKCKVMRVYATNKEDALEQATYQMSKSNRNPRRDPVTVEEISSDTEWERNQERS